MLRPREARNTAYIEIKISSKIQTCEEMLSIVGLPCSEIWNAGDFVNKTTMKREENSLVHNYESIDMTEKDRNAILIDKKLETVIKDFVKVKDKILSIKGVRVEILLALYFTDRPMLGFNSDTLKDISSLNAELSIEVYPA